ncbi:Hypothetical protein CGLY_08880 [Corynebacterium glyciniphilum AJ 3170]|uniref:Uncharacterized protein n=1 Tax=Corynebacterium glyciniphilum AJ 3170 TaxID=1404245 RepID=X5EC90_9CORY|nr:Hypothetical protein CGLY_08880 [Corynebacterium glyciniphilum AJ 3170]
MDAEIARVVQATGVAWDSMVRAFEAAGGAESSHADLAAAVHPLMVGSGVDNPGWWGQGATVAYEKQIGRRVTGQSSAGDFQVAASRTVDAKTTAGLAGDDSPAAVRDRVGAVITGDATVCLVGEPRVSDTPKRSYWRCSLEDGASLEVAVAPKNQTRVTVTLTVSDMVSAEQRETMRAVLKEILAGL